jgi:hypothetical protein
MRDEESKEGQTAYQGRNDLEQQPTSFSAFLARFLRHWPLPCIPEIASFYNTK